jgi:hypothetical protein
LAAAFSQHLLVPGQAQSVLGAAGFLPCPTNQQLLLMLYAGSMFNERNNKPGLLLPGCFLCLLILHCCWLVRL